MSETPTPYSSLPEDLEPVLKLQSAKTAALSVRISRKYISLTNGAYGALSKPERLDVLFGPKSRMLALRPAVGDGRTVTPNGTNGLVQFQAEAFIASLNLPPVRDGQRNSHHFTAQLVEGALLIGPLPEVPS